MSQSHQLAGEGFEIGSILMVHGDVKHSMVPDGFAIYFKRSRNDVDVFRLVVDFNRGEGSPSDVEEPCTIRINCDESSFAILVNDQVACFRYTRPMAPIKYLSVDGNLNVNALIVTRKNAVVPPGDEEPYVDEPERPDGYRVSMFERVEIPPDTPPETEAEDAIVYTTMIRLYPASFYVKMD